MMEKIQELIGQGRCAEALATLREVVDREGESSALMNYVGVCQLRLGRPAEAALAFHRSLDLGPHSAAIYANLGMALRMQNKGEEALFALRKALSLDPAHPQNYLQLFKQFQLMGRWDEAIGVLEEGFEHHPKSLLLAEALAVAYGKVGRAGEAERLFRQIYEEAPQVANSYATWLQEEGRFADSVPILETSLRSFPNQGTPYRLLAEAGTTELFGQPLLAHIEELAKGSIDENAQLHLEYALGKIYDQKGDYAGAATAYRAANALAFAHYPAAKTFDPVWTAREPQLLSQIYTQEFFRGLSPAQPQNDGPIFIVGMIRSGTTLLDQILSSHPEVSSVGEGNFWNAEAERLHPIWRSAPPNADELQSLANRYLASVGRPAGRFIDKMPLNYRNLGPIHSALPKAKIIHIKRDPFDTCLSIYTTYFAGGPNFVYNEDHIALFYRAYLDTMAHWRSILSTEVFTEIQYEDLVRSPETAVRRVLDFLGLLWDDACLEHSKNKKQISTPSRWQARQPIYETSIGKRERYGSFFPILAEL
jgi:tetratricopeptide (TPR) repeat protein